MKRSLPISLFKTSTMAVAVITTGALLASPALAQSADEPGIEGRKLAETIFETMDTTERGAFHLGELDMFNDSAFAGMDYDTDGRVTFEEFSQWDPGFRAIAESLGRGEGYTTALKIMFAIWDQNGDDELSEQEMTTATRMDFARADTDDNGIVTREEFIERFPIIVAMRAVIRPDL